MVPDHKLFPFDSARQFARCDKVLGNLYKILPIPFFHQIKPCNPVHPIQNLNDPWLNYKIYDPFSLRQLPIAN